MTASATRPDLRPRDYLAVDRLLDDEERADPRHGPPVRAGQGRAERRRAGSRRRTIPLRAGARARQPRRARHAPRGLRLRRRERHRVRPRLHGARGRRQRHPQPRLGAGLARDVRDPPLGLGGAEAGVAAADGRGRGDRVLRPDRARLGLGPRLDAHARAARRRRLDPARAEDVDHERLGRRRRRRVGADRRRGARLPRPGRARRASPRRTSTRSCRCARR